MTLAAIGTHADELRFHELELKDLRIAFENTSDIDWERLSQRYEFLCSRISALSEGMATIDDASRSNIIFVGQLLEKEKDRRIAEELAFLKIKQSVVSLPHPTLQRQVTFMTATSLKSTYL